MAYLPVKESFKLKIGNAELAEKVLLDAGECENADTVGEAIATALDLAPSEVVVAADMNCFMGLKGKDPESVVFHVQVRPISQGTLANKEYKKELTTWRTKVVEVMNDQAGKIWNGGEADYEIESKKGFKGKKKGMFDPSYEWIAVPGDEWAEGDSFKVTVAELFDGTTPRFWFLSLLEFTQTILFVLCLCINDFFWQTFIWVSSQGLILPIVLVYRPCVDPVEGLVKPVTLGSSLLSVLCVVLFDEPAVLMFLTNLINAALPMAWDYWEKFGIVKGMMKSSSKEVVAEAHANRKGGVGVEESYNSDLDEVDGEDAESEEEEEKKKKKKKKKKGSAKAKTTTSTKTVTRRRRGATKSLAPTVEDDEQDMYDNPLKLSE